MEKQVITFVVETENDFVKRVGRSFMTIPELMFRDGDVTWYQDSRKAPVQGEEQTVWER